IFLTESSPPSIEASISTSASYVASLAGRTMAPRESGACGELVIFTRGPCKSKGCLSLHTLLRSAISQTLCSWFSRIRHVFRYALADEFLKYSRTRAAGNANEGIGEDEVRPAICMGIVRVGKCAGTHSPEEIRIVRHEMSAVAARNNWVTQCMIQA